MIGNSLEEEHKVLKRIYTKFITFLESEESCLKAGFSFYKKYPWHYDGNAAIAYIIAKDNPQKEYIRTDFTCDLRYDNVYQLQSHLEGKNFMEFIIDFLFKNCPEVCQHPSFFEKNILDRKSSDCYLIHSQIFTKTMEIVKPLRPLKVVEDMQDRLNFINIFPSLHSNQHCGMNETEGFTMRNLETSEKLIDAIINGEAAKFI